MQNKTFKCPECGESAVKFHRLPADLAFDCDNCGHGWEPLFWPKARDSKVTEWDRSECPVSGTTLVNLHVGNSTYVGLAGDLREELWGQADWYSVVETY